MVRLTKIYTKVGDGGRTMLGDGTMTQKSDARVEAYGGVDEANAALGLAVCALAETRGPVAQQLREELLRVQQDLFDLGADLCVPVGEKEAAGSRLRVTPEQVERLEKAIDRFNEPLPALNSFVLPGGREPAARLHLARTVTRRAERAVALLLERDPARTVPLTMIYLNRLSDLLFVAARAVNAESGAGDVLWIPGANRKGEGGSPA
ncbi:MAG TPA: cob(I)yrinic acid a,c-diamide adenosyltransferase [Phycisphaerales bacterium]|nr:cob(I)yrinic acid a,c-diamide adenosyltransferase [Phycisphaerales bacterium]